MIKKIFALNLVNFSFNAGYNNQQYIEYLDLNYIQINRVIEVINKNPEKKEFNKDVLNNIKMKKSYFVINILLTNLLSIYLVSICNLKTEEKLIKEGKLKESDIKYKYFAIYGNIMGMFFQLFVSKNYLDDIFNKIYVDSLLSIIVDSKTTDNIINNVIPVIIGLINVYIGYNNYYSKCFNYDYFKTINDKDEKKNIIIDVVKLLLSHFIPNFNHEIFSRYMMKQKYEKYLNIRKILQNNTLNGYKVLKTKETESIVEYLY